MKFINYCAIIFLLQFIIILSGYHVGFSLMANNPFATNNTKIKNVQGVTTDGKYLVELEYSPDYAKKGEVAFLRIGLFNNLMNNDTRLRHVDCDLTIAKDKTELFKLSSKYGESLYHSIVGSFLASYRFNESGLYQLSVELAGINFIPIKPVFTSFDVSVPANSSENLRISPATSSLVSDRMS